LIIGYGSAGTSAAIWAAKFGLVVIIIESAKFPCNRSRETLHPGVESLFDQLGVKKDVTAAKFIRHKGIWIRWKGGSEDNKNNNDNNNWKLITFGEDGNCPWYGY
jgi:2-polyprenyl-6-methoxyphenol hydroxylase-like FAD-dependent oxidoreductase